MRSVRVLRVVWMVGEVRERRWPVMLFVRVCWGRGCEFVSVDEGGGGVGSVCVCGGGGFNLFVLGMCYEGVGCEGEIERLDGACVATASPCCRENRE